MGLRHSVLSRLRYGQSLRFCDCSHSSIKRGLLTSGGHNAASPTGNNTLSGPREGSFGSGSRKQTGGHRGSGHSFGGGPETLVTKETESS